MEETRQTLLTTIEQARQSALLTRQSEQQQLNLYATRLQAMPEQERQYLEMQSERDAKERQYNYLVERNEENTLLLASGTVPIKMIERPTIHPRRVSPRMMPIMVTAVAIGLLLPLLLFFLTLVPSLWKAIGEPKPKEK